MCGKGTWVLCLTCTLDIFLASPCGSSVFWIKCISRQHLPCITEIWTKTRRVGSFLHDNNHDLPGLHPIIFHIAHLFPFKPAFIVFNPCIDWGSKNSIFAHFTLISCYDTGKNQWFKNCSVVSLSHKHVCISFSICTVLSAVERLWVFALSCLLFRNCWVAFLWPH